MVENGVLSCFRKDGESEKELRKYQPGDAFGELALLYNAPRAASIIADEDCILWALDRSTFNHIVKDSARNRREKFEAFLSKIKILEGMSDYERNSLADAFVQESFKAGEWIIRQAEEGNKMYFIEEGECVCTIEETKGEEK